MLIGPVELGSGRKIPGIQSVKSVVDDSDVSQDQSISVIEGPRGKRAQLTFLD